jgi:hypothetical protein
MSSHRVLFAKCENGHEIPIGSVPDFMTHVQSGQLISNRKPRTCSTCEVDINRMSIQLLVREISNGEVKTAELAQACREWAV